MSAHAVLSASGSHRWLTCTPSAQLETKFPDETSTYASEGSFAHKLAELKLEKYLGRISTRTYNKRLKELEGNEYHSAGLVDYVDSYISFAAERISEAQARSEDAVVMTEQKLDYGAWVPGGFGTGPCYCSDGILDVVDLKYGKGVPVSAEGNSQMRLYGLGALSQFECLYDIKTVRMTICQPRLDSISSDEMTVEELLDWAESYLRPRAQMAMAGEGDFVPGEHCRFCRARFTCRARADANLELAKLDFQEPFLLSDEEIAKVLAKLQPKCRAAMSEYALDQRKSRQEMDRLEAVEGRQQPQIQQR